MKTVLLVLLLSLVLAACSDTSAHATTDYLDRANDILLEAHGDPEQIAKALDIYTKGLEKYPEAPELLTGRANLHASLERYPEARDDMDALYASGHIRPEGRLFRCMLHERLAGKPDADIIGCYEETAHVYSDARESQSHPSANHVLSAFLAESRGADNLLHEWQASDDPMKDPMIEELFLDFDREAYLYQVLP